MKTQILFFISLLLIFSFSFSNAEAKKVTFTWFGQACFLMVSSQNTQILTDPVEMDPYRVPKEIEPDIVTVSHEHFDHNKVDAVSGNPVVLRGLTSKGKAFAQIDRKIKDTRIYTVSTFHDQSEGSQRGKNAVFVFEFDGIRVAHLGDLGHLLSEEQVQAVGSVDVLMIPVGGKYTISGIEAEQVVAQLKPNMLVLPMHFKTDAAQFLPYSGDDFTEGKENVKKISGNTFTLNLSDPPKKLEYVVLDYK